MKTKIIILVGLAVLLAFAGVFWRDALEKLKADGYMAYTPAEAEALAYTKCGQCHNTDRIAKYCMRCGPPLIVVVHNMKSLIRLEREKGRHGLESYTDAQAVAIAQVWNAQVGNWEDTWRAKDLAKLLEGDKALLKLLDTPVKQRPIEAALAGRTAPGAYKEEHTPASQSKP
ncbi:MAG: hypothetical protein HY889_01675 [Deltaproteobacteria bacterium]|nr:hypothetical protein [Deltaproteobacteria bacterium]